MFMLNALEAIIGNENVAEIVANAGENRKSFVRKFILCRVCMTRKYGNMCLSTVEKLHNKLYFKMTMQLIF